MKSVKLNQVILNLGLENNPYTMTSDVVELINTTILNTFETSVIMSEGEYKGNEEKTAIIYCNCESDDIKSITNAVQILCLVFTQEYIPFELNNDKGVLVAHPNMKLEQIKFNSKYFLK